MPSLLPPEPTVSCFDDLDFFNDFENEFPAIVYNDAQTSKSDLLTEPIFSPQHIDEFDDETSFFEYNKEEQNVLYFNDLFPFNIIHPNDLKSEKYNDDNEVDIIQSSEGNEITQECCEGQDMALPPRDQRHQYHRYEGLQYTAADIADFETRLARIYRREVHRVQVFDFGGLPDLMAEGLSARRSMTWRQFILALGLHTTEEMVEDRFGAYWLGNERLIPDKGDLTFLGGGRHLKRHTEGRKSGARLYRGHFIRRLAHHFGLEMTGLPGPKWQQDATAGAPKAAEDAPAVDEGGQAVPAPVQDFTRTYGEINDRSWEILHIDDFMYDTSDGG
ncbi:hypothetical protein Tco_0771542 [Tanacetum coccineum]|uniref:Uncharacterized protein n=1 Tax=Tanacetum coccineum TaxID=301880 RepID=A0ABQ4ZHX9_9ASTR